MRSSKNVRSNTWALRTVSKRTAVTAGPASICSGNESARGRVAQQRATTCSSRLGAAPSRPCRCGHGRDPGPAQIRPLHCAALPCLDVLCAHQLQDRVAEQLPRGIGGVHLKGPCCVRREEREATSEAIGPVPCYPRPHGARCGPQAARCVGHVACHALCVAGCVVGCGSVWLGRTTSDAISRSRKERLCSTASIVRSSERTTS